MEEIIDIKIQLIGDDIAASTGYLDITENTDFPITFSLADIRDISKRTGSFSKTIKLAGTKNNNILLNNYFDVNVVGNTATFNVNRIQKCIVLIDNAPILNDAFIQLLSVNKIETTDLHTDSFEYSVQIKDNISDLFTKIKGLELTDIKFDGFRHLYTDVNVIDSWDNPNEVYKYLMPFNSTLNDVDLTSFRPAIKLKYYFDRIFANAGYSYQWDTLEDVGFDKLYIPYNGAQLKLSQEDINRYFVNADLSTPGDYVSPTTPALGELTYFYTQQIIADNEIQDNESLYDPVLGEYESFFNSVGNTGLSVTVDIEYEIILQNNSGANAYLVTTQPSYGPSTTGRYRVTPQLSLDKNGSTTALNNINEYYIPGNGATAYPNGETILLSATATRTLTTQALLNDVIKTQVGIVTEQTNSNAPVYFRDGSLVTDDLVDVDVFIRVSEYTIKILPSLNNLTYNSEVNLAQFVPLKVKQGDLIKSICKMFNLFIETDKYNKSKLNIYTRDNYYDSGDIVNWTKLLNKDKQQDITFLSEITKKSTILTYKEDKDYYNTEYKNVKNEIYGQQEFIFDSEYVRDTEVQELIFSPTPIYKNTLNQVVPCIDGVEPKNNIRVLYSPDELFPCNNWRIKKYENGYTSILTTYPLFSHFDKPINPSIDFNFGICDFYFVNGVVLTNNNLFNMYWRRTMNQLNNSKMLSAYFDLTPKDILNLRLNAKIRIDNSYWNINTISDYNPNKVGPTKVELISIDEELKLAPFTQRTGTIPLPPGFPTPGNPVIFDPVGPVLEPIRPGLRDTLRNQNLVLSLYDGNLDGTGNTIGTNNKYFQVVGNDNDIQAEITTVNGTGNKVFSDATIYGDGNDIAAGLEYVEVIGSDIQATQNGLYVNNLTVTESFTLAPGIPISGLGFPEVLAEDNTTGGYNIIISSGNVIFSENSLSAISLDDNGVDGNIYLSILGVETEMLTEYWGTTSDNGVDVSKITIEPDTLTLDTSGDINIPNIGTTTPLTVLALDASGNVVNGNALVGAGTIVTVSTTASISNKYTLCDTTSSAYTVTLPDAILNTAVEYSIKDKSGNANTYNITIDSVAGDIDGNVSFILNVPYQSITVVSDGTDWWII